MFDVSKDEELKLAFSWKKTQPLFKNDHQQKGIKIKFLQYQLHFLKAYQFINLKEEEGFNENIHCENIQHTSKEKISKYQIVYNHLDEIWSIDLADFSDFKISNYN